MFDCKVLIYSDKQVKKIQLQNLISERRVLICSVTKHISSLHHNYFAYLNQIRKYYQNEIDDVILLNSNNGIYSQIRLERFDINLLYVSDSDTEFVSWLKTKQNKTQSVSYLAKFWDYQVLLNNGEIECFYEQPTENRIDKLINSKLVDAEFLKKFEQLAQFDERLIFDRCSLRYGDEQTDQFGGKLFYYNLWPNVKLEDYLRK